MIGIAEAQGANIVNKDRMWHYTEGLTNWNPIWPGHGIRVLPAPSSLWLDATGKRLPPFLYPGSDTLATLKYICSTGFDYTWFILDQTIIAREVALSGRRVFYSLLALLGIGRRRDCVNKQPASKTATSRVRVSGNS